MSRSIELEMTIDINAPPSMVWPYLVDWERLGSWMLEASEFRVLTDHSEGVGVVAEATIRIGPISTVDRIQVTVWEPPALLELEHVGWVKGHGVMESHALDAATRLHWKERLIPPWGALGALGIRVWKPMMRRTFLRDLQALKALVESDQR